MMVGGLCMLLSVSAKAQQSRKKFLSEVIKSLPSPLKMSNLLKDLETPYPWPLFNPVISAKNYLTKYQQALNLGVYSTDLSFAMVYEKITDGSDYLAAIEHLAKDLKVAQGFDRASIEAFLIKEHQQDSLFLVTKNNLTRVNEQLIETNRSELAILMSLGGWLESLYVTCWVHSKAPKNILKSRIGNQKIVLEQLMLLLSFYEAKPAIKKMIQELRPLQKVFDKIKFDFQYNDPNTKEDDNGILISDDDISTKVFLTDRDAKAIYKLTTKIRQKIVQGK